VVSTSATNRRIGQRLPSPGLTVTWRVPRRTRWRTRVVEEVVDVANVSATGAAIVAPTAADLRRDQVLELDCEGLAASARIRRIVPGSRPGVSYYGVQFVDPSPEVVDLLLSRAGLPRAEDLEAQWNRAR
jgi:hypothetical protein